MDAPQLGDTIRLGREVALWQVNARHILRAMLQMLHMSSSSTFGIVSGVN